MSVSTPADATPLSRNVSLGDPVVFTHYLQRGRRREAGQPNRTWVRVAVSALLPVDRDPRPLMLNGILIGKRTLWDGDVQWEDSYAIFSPKVKHRAYVVAWDLNRKPLYVLAGDVVL